MELESKNRLDLEYSKDNSKTGTQMSFTSNLVVLNGTIFITFLIENSTVTQLLGFACSSV